MRSHLQRSRGKGIAGAVPRGSTGETTLPTFAPAVVGGRRRGHAFLQRYRISNFIAVYRTEYGKEQGRATFQHRDTISLITAIVSLFGPAPHFRPRSPMT